MTIKTLVAATALAVVSTAGSFATTITPQEVFSEGDDSLFIARSVTDLYSGGPIAPPVPGGPRLVAGVSDTGVILPPVGPSRRVVVAPRLVSPVSVSVVPLPAGGLLLLSGLAAVACLKRRKAGAA